MSILKRLKILRVKNQGKSCSKHGSVNMKKEGKTKMNGKDAVKNIIYGVAIGDAAGCPVQFFERGDVKKLNITDLKKVFLLLNAWKFEHVAGW